MLPPVAKLSSGQAMYHFLSGYTSKVAGTERGIVDPEVTFSACFGAAFMPLHPTRYSMIASRWHILQQLMSGPVQLRRVAAEETPNTQVYCVPCEHRLGGRRFWCRTTDEYQDHARMYSGNP